MVSNRTLVIAIIVIAFVLWSRPVFATKSGAVLSVKPEIEYARRVLANLWRQMGLDTKAGYPLTVTSGYDGTHSAKSLHYEGLAEDYRTRDLSTADAQMFATRARDMLGSQYDVVLEATHLHVEFDPA